MSLKLDDFMNLEETGVSYGLEGLKILIYGRNTLGKTPQSMKFPKPILLCAEAGGSAIKGIKHPIITKKDFLDFVTVFTNPKNVPTLKEKYQTIVIDTIEDIIEIFEQAIAAEFGVRDVSEVAKVQKGTNGYAIYRKEFKSQINALCNCGYTIIFIAHEEVVNLGDKENERWFIMPKGSNGEKGSSRFIRDLCDFRWYIKSNGIDPETKKTQMSTAWCVETDEFYAGSRFDCVPYVNPFTAENIIEAMTNAQKKSAENQDSNLVEFNMGSKKNYTKNDYLEDIKPYMSTLYKLYPNEVIDIVYAQLGEGAKVSDAKESQLLELETIYNNLSNLAFTRNVEI